MFLTLFISFYFPKVVSPEGVLYNFRKLMDFPESFGDLCFCMVYINFIYPTLFCLTDGSLSCTSNTKLVKNEMQTTQSTLNITETSADCLF